jgi:hypothetical protein
MIVWILVCLILIQLELGFFIYWVRKDIQRLMKDFASLLLYICKLEERLIKLEGKEQEYGKEE